MLKCCIQNIFKDSLYFWHCTRLKKSLHIISQNCESQNDEKESIDAKANFFQSSGDQYPFFGKNFLQISESDFGVIFLIINLLNLSATLDDLISHKKKSFFEMCHHSVEKWKIVKSLQYEKYTIHSVEFHDFTTTKILRDQFWRFFKTKNCYFNTFRDSEFEFYHVLLFFNVNIFQLNKIRCSSNYKNGNFTNSRFS